MDRRSMVSGALQAVRHLIPDPVRHHLRQARLLQAHPGITARDIDRVHASLAKTIDIPRLERLHQQHRRGAPDVVAACDYATKLRIAIVKALVDDLHVAAPMRMLDIGMGGGYFVAVCRHLGHTADGTEVPTTCFDATVAHLYEEISGALGCPCERRLMIRAHTPLELSERYDRITAHKICFNDHGKPTEWGVAEWQSFLTDAREHLLPGGTMVLELNEHVARYGVRRWYDAEQLALFSSAGTVTGNVITIPA